MYNNTNLSKDPIFNPAILNKDDNDNTNNNIEKIISLNCFPINIHNILNCNLSFIKRDMNNWPNLYDNINKINKNIGKQENIIDIS